ncbi:MAG: hypothetical protein ABFS86_13410 [Planctomycetota bacterium]
MAIDNDFLVVLTSNEIGVGEADLGEKLTELFLKSLGGNDVRPAKILFLNSAIFLTTEGSHHLDALRALEEGGTELVSCITCLTYHGRMERLEVGQRGDMKGTVADMTAHARVVTL